MNADAECAERFLYALFATVVKPISDLPLLISGLCSMLFALSLPAQAQQPRKVSQIGVLHSGFSGASSAPLNGFRQGLRELGYEDGKNIVIEYRFAEGKVGRLPDLAAELVQLKVDVILASGGTPAILAAKNATSTIPIVFPTAGNPIELGIVASLARPGGNITGLANRPAEFSGKKLELLKEVVPQSKRVAVLGQEGNTSHALDFKEARSTAPAMGLQVFHVEVRSPGDFEAAFLKITGTIHASALYLQTGSIFADHPPRIAALTLRFRLPAISDTRTLAEAGVLMSYGSDRFDQGRRAATFVDKILKGAKPAELPVEQPRKFELVINLKTAKQIGLTIPPNVLARADKVIR